jgi:cell division protein FtsB
MKISAVKTVYALIVLCGILYAFVLLRGPNGIPAMFEKRRLVHEYETSNQELQRDIEQKQQRIKRLESDPAEQELEIRQRMKLAKPGEKIYILGDGKAQ